MSRPSPGADPLISLSLLIHPVLPSSLSVGRFSAHAHTPKANAESSIADVKREVEPVTKLPPEALKVFFRGRPRRDDDKLVLLGVKQFQKLVIVGNPNWTPPQPEGAAPATTSGGAKTKLDEILDAIKPLESEAMAAVSAGSATTETQKARLQELLTQKMLQLDSVEVQGSDGREKRKRAIQSIERLCTDIENMGD